MMLWLLLFQLHATEPCATILNGPIDLSGISYDRHVLRELTTKERSATSTLEFRAAGLARAERNLTSARARLGWLDRWLFQVRVPLNPDVRRALKRSLRQQRALIAHNVAADEASWLNIQRRGLLYAHPEFKALNEAQSRVFSGLCDVTLCLRELETAALRIDQVRGTEEWELNHAFDPKFSDRVDNEVDLARQTVQQVDLFWERSRDAARELGIEVPDGGLPRPTTEHHGPGVPLVQMAEEIEHMQMRARHLESQLMDLRAKLAARIEAYLLNAL